VKRRAIALQSVLIHKVEDKYRLDCAAVYVEPKLRWVEQAVPEENHHNTSHDRHAHALVDGLEERDWAEALLILCKGRDDTHEQYVHRFACKDHIRHGQPVAQPLARQVKQMLDCEHTT
jgi:hypothetical protein